MTRDHGLIARINYQLSQIPEPTPPSFEQARNNLLRMRDEAQARINSNTD